VYQVAADALGTDAAIAAARLTVAPPAARILALSYGQSYGDGENTVNSVPSRGRPVISGGRGEEDSDASAAPIKSGRRGWRMRPTPSEPATARRC